MNKQFCSSAPSLSDAPVLIVTGVQAVEVTSDGVIMRKSCVETSRLLMSQQTRRLRHVAVIRLES